MGEEELKATFVLDSNFVLTRAHRKHSQLSIVTVEATALYQPNRAYREFEASSEPP